MRLHAINKWPIITGLLALLVYLLTLAPDLTWANYGVDGGELITAAISGGVPHPPGYPTYVLIGKLFSYVPLGTVAYRFNLLSAVATAIAAAFVTATASQLLASRLPNGQLPDTTIPFVAIAAGLTFAFAPLVWSQAIIAEVYGLNLAFVAAFLWALLSQRPTWLVGLLLGVSITTHLTSLLLIPLALALTPRGRWLPLTLGISLGLAPFLLPAWLAQTDSPVVWGEPATPGGWWWLVSGRLYHHNVFGLPTARLWPRLQRWIWLWLNQFTLLGLPLVAAGLVSAREGKQYWLVATATLYTLYAFTYDAEDAAVLLLPSLLLLSIVLAQGLQRLGWVALFLPLASLLLNFNTQNLSDDRPVRPLAEQLLQTAPPDAILLTPGDPTIFTLWYFQHVEGQRPDLILVDRNLFAFDWYRQRLRRTDPELEGLDLDDLVRFQRYNKSERPVCSVSLITPGDVTPITNSCLEDSS
ncbi:MAG TPA: DUF2723 domain-containing protein [Anaerolineae bacterium]